MKAFQCNSLRELINEVNARKIQKNDIVEIFHGESGYVIIYYAENE